MNKRPNKVLKSMKQSWQIYLLAFPALLYLFIFNYLPMYGLQMAFMDFVPSKGYVGSEWVGFEQFERFFSSYQFWPTITNTIVLSFYSLIAGFLPPIILALALNNLRSKKFQSAVQTITYAPHFISIVVVVSMIRLLFSPSSGIVNKVIVAMGGTATDFIGSADIFPHLYVISEVWQHMGWSSIIYLAALSSISPDLYEAAKVDGATRWQTIVNIDIPSIAPTAITLLILACGRVMNLGMQKVLLMQTGTNLGASEIIATYVYKQGILGMQYSYSTAIGLFQAVINVAVLVTINHIARKTTESSLW